MRNDVRLDNLKILFPEFIFHNKFLDEVSELLKGPLKGTETQFIGMFYGQLSHIRDLGPDAIKLSKNERLKGFDGKYCSLHIHRKQFNIRLLVHISEGEPVTFLCAFAEKSGKSATDYSKYTPAMVRRYNELQGGD